MKNNDSTAVSQTPQVAILLSDIREARALALDFEKLGVIADFFNSVEDYLIAQIKNSFDLTVFDISLCIYEGKPLVLRGEVSKTKMAFFYTDDTEKDLSPTYGMTHLGYIDAKRNVSGQVRNILKRYNKEMARDAELKSLKSGAKDYISKQKNYIANIEALKEKSGYLEESFRLVKELEKACSENQLKDAAPQVFDNVAFIKSYCLLELNENNSKLIPSFVSGRKNVQVPSLWLGLENDQSIAKYAASVAKNVISNIVDGPLITLNLTENGVDTSAIMILEVIPTSEFKIDWQVLETLVSGIYARNKYRKIEKVTSIRSNTVIDLFESIKKENTQRLIAVDMSDIIDYLEISKGSSFSWQKFFDDFKFSLTHFVNSENVFCISPEVIAISVENHVFDECYDLTNETVSRTSLIRYFENVKSADIQNLSLYVSELPVSEFALMEFAQKKTQRILEAGL